MASIEKRKGARGTVFKAQVRMRGVNVSRTFDTLAEARYWAADTERQIKAGQGHAVSGRTLRDVFDRFMREDAPTRPGSHWELNRLDHFRRDPIADVNLVDLSADTFDRWQKRRLQEVSGATLRRDRALLSVVLKRAVRVWKWLPENPLPDVPLPADNPPRSRIATDAEISRLIHAAGDDLSTIQARVALAFAFAVETGMRGGEIAAMVRADAPAGRAWIHVPKSKNGDSRDVPLSAKAQMILDRVRAQHLVPTLWGFTTVQKDAIFRKMTKRAGIDGLNFHDSRATAITRLSKKLDILALARMIGHRDLASLQTYYRESAEELARRL